MMKVLIFEGPDNLGKSTIIRQFEKIYRNQYEIHKFHCTGPVLDNPDEDPFDAQCRQFRALVAELLKLNKSDANVLAIIDRSWIGEYVYGQIYRNGNPDKIMQLINMCNLQLSDAGIQTIYVRLTATPEFIISHDDNLSFTSGYDPEKRLAAVTKEDALFEEAYHRMRMYYSSKKITVQVQNGVTDNYRNINDIFDEINNAFCYE